MKLSHEWMIASRYLRARRSEGGVTMMTWISLIGITLAVFALVVTMSVRAGFRGEFVETVLGANAHVSVYDRRGKISDASGLQDKLSGLDQLRTVAPVVGGKVMASANGETTGLEVRGMALADYLALDGIAPTGIGAPDQLEGGIAIGREVARQLDLSPGDDIKLISPDGVKTPFGTSPRVKTYPVVQIFEAGRYDIDATRGYLIAHEAQLFFNKDGLWDRLDIQLHDPDALEAAVEDIEDAIGDAYQTWTWRQANGSFLRALKLEDNVMFIILSILVLIAAMNIISGLVMMARNRQKDIGILRTMGASQGTIMRIFFLCGATTGTVGTCAGLALGISFSLNLDHVFALIGYFSGQDIWDPEVRGIYLMDAEIRASDLLLASGLSLGLSWFATLIPSRKAARMDPVEALRDE